ncbi:hypothetical protein Ndes2526B_g03743 [Nannochloris sp. 'desiccata']|nr:hypothetical protein KSW81_005392 [Chlorella desiccata (nom. nud.)]KAH7621399.1 putative Pyruvate dehydrogenase E1 component subunit alpha-3, chloroplastic [Chlorella desiccata (nom. nud.)]
MATAQSRAIATPLAEVATPRMPAMASGMALRGAPLRLAQRRPAASRRMAVSAKAIATPVKPSAPAKKGDQISAEQAKELYRDMVLGRDFEDMCAQMYYRGKMFGFVHLYCGQEAVSTGVIKACLRKDDYISSTYRDHVHALSKGVTARKVMAELFGKKTGTCRGQGGSMHMFDSEFGLLGGYAFIGEGIPVGVGAAFQIAYKKRVLNDDSADQVAVNFFGDGTCNVGQFYESLNMAALYKLPVIFVVENNKWAIGMSHARATGTNLGDEEPWIHKKGPAFGMPGIRVDGMDLMKVREVAIEAVARARRGEGPTLIEAETYRFRGHSLADPDELRDKKEKDHYAARDPIPQFRNYMLKNGLATEEEIKALEQSVTDEVEDCVKFADESPKPDMSQLLENVFADPKGFGIGPDGRYRYEQPGFTSGLAEMS